MLNPYLEKTLYSQPIQPIVIEIDPSKFTDTMSQLLGLNIFASGLFAQNKPFLEPIPTFSLAGIGPVTPEIIRFINSLPGVRIVHANLQARAIQQLSQPSDWWPTSESRTLLEAEEAFKQGFTGEAIKVGVTDTGVDVSNPQLVGAEFYSTISWPFREVLDENGHGSHTASTIAGKLYNSPVGIMVEGVSRAQLICIKCLGRGIGTGFTSEILNAMAVCYEKSAQVISMSLGTDEIQGGVENDPLCRMVTALTRRGIIVVVAAGNSGPDADTIGSPAASPEAVTVAAIDKSGKVASFSSRGGSKFPSKPDVAAPGVLVYSGTSHMSPMSVQQPQAGYGFTAISGTSMSCPHVSGFVSLLKHKYPSFTTERFKEVMAAKGQAHDYALGHGVPKWSYF